jgi:hypothetical protein
VWLFLSGEAMSPRVSASNLEGFVCFIACMRRRVAKDEGKIEKEGK